ncbi:MAG: hypothetical protein LBQ21_02945 [Clostridiales Family XIII bacterium]|jgi:hypothetical protein|nr:hypothetical protein [Clostridiales Family XIII bacterium]
MDERYLYRKNFISAIMMIVLAVIQLVLCSGLGYYWNALQGKLAGITMEDSSGHPLGTLFVFILVFVPLVVFAFYGFLNGEKDWVKVFLGVPCLVYGLSAILEVQKILPIEEKFKDIYVTLDNAIYLPFAVAYVILVVYYFFVLRFPASSVTRGIGIITVVISIGLYAANGVYTAYMQLMDVLDGSFGAMSFLLYLVCFALDTATYFLMLSILMTYCTMRREARAAAHDEQVDQEEAVDSLEQDSE